MTAMMSTDTDHMHEVGAVYSHKGSRRVRLWSVKASITVIHSYVASNVQ